MREMISASRQYDGVKLVEPGYNRISEVRCKCGWRMSTNCKGDFVCQNCGHKMTQDVSKHASLAYRGVGHKQFFYGGGS